MAEHAGDAALEKLKEACIEVAESLEMMNRPSVGVASRREIAEWLVSEGRTVSVAAQHYLDVIGDARG